MSEERALSSVSVLHVGDKFGVGGSTIHGVTRLFSWWLPAYNPARFEVRLVGLRKPDAATLNLQASGIDVISLSRSKYDPRTLFDLLRLIRQHKVRLLHLHGYGSSNFGILAAKLSGVKCVMHEHFVDPRMPNHQKPFDFLLARFADYGIAVSKSVKEFMVRRRYVPEAKVEVVYNGAPLKEFQRVSLERIKREKERWGIPEGCKVVTTIGRVGQQKGCRYFVEAVPTVLARHPTVKFLIVGDGPLLEEMKQHAADLGVAHAVIFTGFYTDIPAILSITDISAFPSLWEGTPLTLFEAMSVGLPIVSTNVDGLGELLEDGVTAALVAPADAGALADALIRTLDDPAKAQAMAAAAFAASKSFDITRSVRRMEDIYDEVLQGTKA